MIDELAAAPLYSLIRKIRRPARLGDLMAACLRSIYMGDPFTKEEGVLPAVPAILLEEVSTVEREIFGVRCVIYLPKSCREKLPLMLYMHGGGFVVGCSEDTDYITRMLCHSNQMIVVSINYLLAPEAVYPAALDNCQQVLEALWTEKNSLPIDTTSIYLAGDSAGGNLAVALFDRLGRNDGHSHCKSVQGCSAAIKGLILLAPWLDMEVEAYPSYNRLAPGGIVFDAAFIAYARAAYVGFENWKKPQVSPLFSSLSELPPTLALIGTADPLLDQVLKLQEKARALKCEQIEAVFYQNMPHCFYSFPGLFNEEQDCFQRIAHFIGQTTNSCGAPSDRRA